jgi:ABC-type uncharacterized transport system ATPase subunit
MVGRFASRVEMSSHRSESFSIASRRHRFRTVIFQHFRLFSILTIENQLLFCSCAIGSWDAIETNQLRDRIDSLTKAYNNICFYCVVLIHKKM